MSKALIQYKGINAGILKETDEGYEFSYNEEYLADAASLRFFSRSSTASFPKDGFWMWHFAIRISASWTDLPCFFSVARIVSAQ